MSAENQLTPDSKGYASLTMGDVIGQTIESFPEERFRPNVILETPHYTLAGIDTGEYSIWPTADGIGTKPELAERLYTEDGNPEHFKGLAYDTFAMIDGDEARFGRFMVGVAEIVDANTANPEVIEALAQGAKEACTEGGFALLNGETAELGYRTAGYGDSRVNWNAVGISVVNNEKLILGDRLAAGQPVVAFREESIRSNGLTKARNILETAYLLRNHNTPTKDELVALRFRLKGIRGNDNEVLSAVKEIMGGNIIEQVHLPWHRMFNQETKQLLRPSRLYGRVIYEAQGGIEGERKVDMVAAAHVTGGGIPEKGQRMVSPKGLGLSLDPVFPDPEAVTSLLQIASTLPSAIQERIGINDRIASMQWNRGIGFLVVTSDEAEARKLIDIANNHKVEARVAGEVTDKQEISFRGQSWSY